MQAQLVLDAQATLGEGPAWDARTQTLYWVDILERRLHVYDGEDHSIQLEDYVGCVAPCRDGRLVLALGLGFWTMQPDGANLTRLASPDGEASGNRFNDGKCDPAGRMLAGTMDLAERAASGSLYSLEPDGRINRLLSGIRISNGLAWSPDHRTLYYIDTPTREIKAFDYDLESGQIGNPRVAIRIPRDLGSPDGMTSDTQGHLWVAMWGGARLTRWDPRRAELLEQIPVPSLNVTSCVFGGGGMNELFVTSARKGMDQAALEAYPNAGGLFRLQTDVTGIPTFEFGH